MLKTLPSNHIPGLIGFCLLLFSFFGVRGQKLNFVKYSNEEGLVQSQAQHIEQDAFGYLWVSTLGGISRFDGTRFVNYSRRSGLRSQIVYRCAYQEGKGLWLGTHNGLQLYDGKSFTDFPAGDGDPGLTILQMLPFAGDGLLVLDSKGQLRKVVKRRLRAFDAYTDLIFTDLALDRAGNAYGISGTNIYNISAGTSEAATRLAEIGAVMELIYFDTANRMWLGTADGVYRREGGQFLKILGEERLRSDITSLMQDNAGNLWVGTTSGAYRINSGDQATYVGADAGLTDHTINHITEDREHNLWFATDADGIYRLSASPVERYDSSQGLNGSVVMGMARDELGRVWIGTTDGGLSVYDNGSFAKTALPSARAEARRINSLFGEDSGRLWVGTLGSGLWKRENDQFARVLTADGKQLNDIYAIGQDQGATVWVTSSTGLYYYAGGTLQSVSGIEGPGFSLFGLSADTLLVGTTSGLYSVTQKSRVSKMLLENRELYTVNCIKRSGKYLLVGTEDDGIIFWDRHSKKVFQCSGVNGLPSDFIYSIYPESDTSLLAGTGKGVSRISYNSPGRGFRVSNFSTSGSRYGPECNLNAVLPLNESKIWFGTTRGIFSYSSANYEYDDPPPLIYLRSVTVMPWDKGGGAPADTLSSWYKVPASLQLSPAQNHVTFDFEGVYLSNPEGLRYRYRLVGVDPDYSAPVSTNRIIYPNLNPGEYRFRAIAMTDNQMVSGNEIDFPFVIETPVYQKTWFRAMAVALLLLLGFSFEFIRSRLKQRRINLNRKIRLDEQNQILERTSEDLHDDLGNKITRITVLTDVLQRKIGTADAEQSNLVRQIRENAESLYLSTRDIIWALTPGQDTLLDIMEKCRNLGVQLFADTEIDFSVKGIRNGMKNISVPLSIARNLNMIVKEAFTNILKHSGAETVVMDVSFSQDRCLQMVILDDGRGYTRHPGKGHGLNNMEKRMERVGGEISFSSPNSKGFSVTLRVKIPQKEG